MKNIINWIVISDIHAGDQLGLCPISGVRLDEGGTYKPSTTTQIEIWRYWDEFWNEWVPKVTKGEKFGVILNGDTIDGVPHKSTHQISHNLSDQANIAAEILGPIVEKCNGNFYMIRGTEAHVGKSGEEEEKLAKRLGAIPNDLGQYARYDLWKEIGNGLVHILHHIGTTSSNSYEATAVNKELTEEFNEAARWRERPPDIIIRSHRHRHIKISIPAKGGSAIAEVTPGWQGKTPFAWKTAGARLTLPQFGGVLIRQGNDELYTRNIVWSIGRSRAE